MSSKQQTLLQIVSNTPSEPSIKENISLLTNDRLCEIIVCFRYLGIMRDESVLAMEELSKRRVEGGQFNFEEKITELMVDLPSINLDINKILKTIRI